MDTETTTGSPTMATPDLALVAGEPAHRMPADQAAELLLEMAALTRVSLGAHRSAVGSTSPLAPPAEPAPAAPAPAAVDVPSPPALDIPALDIPALDIPRQPADRDRASVLQEIAFLDE